LVGKGSPQGILGICHYQFWRRVYWDNSSDVKEEDARITHQIIDRPRLLNPEIASREYVQPQWVYDSINTRVRIPVEAYGVGKQLPPHLSPFVDDSAQGYIPEYRKKLDEYYKAEFGESLLSGKDLPAVASSEESDDDAQFEDDLEAEKKGSYKDQPTNLKRKRTTKANEKQEADQQTTIAKSLLSNKKRRIVNQVQYGDRLKQRDLTKLERKKDKLGKGLAFVNAEGIIEYSAQQKKKKNIK